jgi:DNA polymerase-4
MLRAGLVARVVVVKLKYADFTLRTRRATLRDAVADTGSIYTAARHLLERFDQIERGVRLTGVALMGLSSEAPPTLFPDEAAQKRRKLEQVIATVSDRFGDVRLTRAALLKRPDRAR